MLRIADIRNERERIINGLEKKRLQNAGEHIDELLNLDENRKKVQSELDAVLNESNIISRQIGALMKAGEKENAEKAKVLGQQAAHDVGLVVAGGRDERVHFQQPGLGQRIGVGTVPVQDFRVVELMGQLLR